ncbi:MAG: hypothetical protein Unbinned5179contig1000_17 [Prokaryotic dsDNA virus sp.]|nr:MAG: hypothetical protein Unbinned5179contig1000_17 [Prokaryotic dsDNA virus sp.]|tara:strand:+ start:2420 stop:3169 length:750 start_codon:yes stop_codon:yes gene_type:complete
MSILNSGVSSGNILQQYLNNNPPQLNIPNPDLTGFNDTLHPNMNNNNPQQNFDINNFNANASAGYGNYVVDHNKANQGNLVTAVQNDQEEAEDEIVESSTYTGLDNIGEGFDPSTLGKENLMSFQKDLMNAGYDLPEFGADGGWGNETMGAWNTYLSDKSGTGDQSEDSMLSIAASNENLTNNTAQDANNSIDQSATDTIQDSNTQIEDATSGAEAADPKAAAKASRNERLMNFANNIKMAEYSNPFAR